MESGKVRNQAIKRLTNVAIQAATAPGRYPDGDGLYLYIAKGGSKSWIFRFQWDRKLKDMGLGSVREVSLKEAREAAGEARRLVRDGKNPIIERKLGGLRTATTPDFKTYAEQYIANAEGQWKNDKHRAQWRMTIDVYARPLHGLKVSAIETAHVYEVLRPIWLSKSETASRLRGRIEKILDAAKTAGFREGENPARWAGHLEHLLPKRKKLTRGHHAAMPYEEVPAYVQALRKRETIVARALEFHILTAARPGMVENMRLEHIDWVNGLWVVPAAFMKVAVDHVVPLVPRAMEILRELKHTSKKGYVFWARRRGSKISNSTLKREMSLTGAGEYTPHGFRSSFKDWAGDETAHDDETSEHALAHQVGSETRRAYRRRTALKKRRALLDEWDGFISSVKMGVV